MLKFYSEVIFGHFHAKVPPAGSGTIAVAVSEVRLFFRREALLCSGRIYPSATAFNPLCACLLNSKPEDRNAGRVVGEGDHLENECLCTLQPAA